MLQTPQLVYGAIKRTIQNVCPLQAKIEKNIEHISITLLKLVPMKSLLPTTQAHDRHGVRKQGSNTLKTK